MEIDGTSIDEHFFGFIDGIKRKSLQGTYTPKATGLYTLHIENFREGISTPCLYNYIDNITLTPAATDFYSNLVNVPCGTGATATFDLDAGSQHGVSNYWIGISASGTFPGVPVGGVILPLNWDALFLFSLANPGFPGSVGFFDTLDAGGKAQASLNLPPDPSQILVGIPLNFAYLLMKQGFSNITHASLPVHLKYVP